MLEVKCDPSWNIFRIFSIEYEISSSFGMRKDVKARKKRSSAWMGEIQNSSPENLLNFIWNQQSILFV